MKLKNNISRSGQLVVALVLLILLASCNYSPQQYYSATKNDNIVRIGIIYSETGSRSITERSMRDAAAMAVEEINNDGGLLGKQLELVAMDNESKDNLYRGIVVNLINKYHVKAVFCNIPEGVRTYIESKSKKGQSLIFDLSDYLKKDENSDIVKLGSSPAQLLYPGVSYLLNNKSNSFTHFFLVGTPDPYSKSANRALKAYLASNGVHEENIGERMIETDAEDVSDLIVQIKRIATSGRACILNTMTGSANLTFFKEFANQGLSASGCPIMSFTISEDEMRSMGAEFNIGHYFCRNYFQSMDTDKNIRFVSDFKLFSAINEFPGGIDRVTGEAIARVYTGVYLWKKAVEKAGSFEKQVVRDSLPGTQFNSPAGMVQINKRSLTLDKPALVAESDIEGQMTVLWQSRELIPAFKGIKN